VKVPAGPDAERLAESFQEANKKASDRGATLEEYRSAEQAWRDAMATIASSPTFGDIETLIFKRSFPFDSPRERTNPGPRWTPDLFDCLSLWPETRIAVIYRDPSASTYSCLRRRFDTDLRRLAVICAEQLTLLSGQVEAIGAGRVQVVRYRELCQNPARELKPLASFFGLSLDELTAAADGEQMSADGDGQYRVQLDKSDADWLDDYFRYRRGQWSALSGIPRSCNRE
jgi:hypothetical protein